MKKLLLIRFSSLGDVVLASSAIECLRAQGMSGFEIHFLTSSEYASLLEGHPGLKRVWSLDRRAVDARAQWQVLKEQLRAARFDEVIDLHGSLRTCELKSALRVFKWRTVPKDRLRMAGYFIFKGLWPKAFRPRRVLQRIAQTVGRKGDTHTHKIGTDLSHLIAADFTPSEKSYFVVMPSSLWQSKCWPVESYAEWIRKFAGTRTAWVVGSSKDHASRELVDRLQRAGCPVRDGVGRHTLPELARVLRGAEFYFGSDTGIAHLAEAVGTRAVVLFGPTTPDVGFGPWRAESRAIGREDLWCRPCSKDGRVCIRIDQPYACLRGLRPESVGEVL